MIIIDNSFNFSDFRKLVCSSDSAEKIKYVFRSDEVFVENVNWDNSSGVQFLKLNVYSKEKEIPYYLSYHYKCKRCFKEYDVPSFVVASTENKIRCDTVDCPRYNMSPILDKRVSRSIYEYYGRINGNSYIFLSFSKLNIGVCDVAGFKVGNPWGRPTIYVVDTKNFVRFQNDVV